jgi:tetrahydromethanopterin S-methyltransferase subunit G
MDTMVPEKKWTDDRLDELSTKVDAGFARVDGDIRELKGEMNQRFDRVDKRFEKVEGKIESGVKDLDSKFDTKFDGLHKTLLGSAVSVIVTLIVCCATLIGVAVL